MSMNLDLPQNAPCDIGHPGTATANLARPKLINDLPACKGLYPTLLLSNRTILNFQMVTSVACTRPLHGPLSALAEMPL